MGIKRCWGHLLHNQACGGSSRGHHSFSSWLLPLGPLSSPVMLLPPARRFQAGIRWPWLQTTPAWPRMTEGKPVRDWIRTKSHHPLLSSSHDCRNSQLWVSSLTATLELSSSTPSKAGPPWTQGPWSEPWLPTHSHPQRSCPQHRSIHSLIHSRSIFKHLPLCQACRIQKVTKIKPLLSQVPETALCDSTETGA